MADCFLKIFNISVTASYLVVAVLLLRLILKKAPKWSICLLWGIVALRLIMPFSFESRLSLVPSANAVVVSDNADAPFKVNTGVSAVDTEINDIIIENKDSINNINQSISGGVISNNDSESDLKPNTTENLNGKNNVESKKIKVSIFTVFGLVWLLGIVAMLIYSAISYAVVRKKVKVCLHYRDNIYFCDNVDTSFILGIFRPKVYIQSDMTQQNTDYVIKHECAHLKRCDHLIKPFAFLLLSVHWFNPLVWVSYILLCRDIESACDEKVVKDAADIDIKGYSTALLNCGTKRRMIIACPVAFGEVSVKSRIRAVLKYKRPPRILCIMAVVLSVALSVCFLTDPIQKVGALSEVIEYETVVEYINRTQNNTTDNSNKQNSLFNNILSVFKGDNSSNANTSSTNSTISQGNNSNNYADVDVNGFVDLFVPDTDIIISDSDSSVNSSTNSSEDNKSENTSTVTSPDNNSSQNNTSSGNASSTTENEQEKSELNIKSLVFSKKTVETDRTGDEVICYHSSDSIGRSDFFVDGDYVHMALIVYGDETSYVYVVFDTNTASIVLEKSMPDFVGEMHNLGDELWISYPNLHCIKIYDKETFLEKETLDLGTTVHSFDFYKDYLIFTESDQWVKAYRYNLKTGQKDMFDAAKYWYFYEADVLVNQELGLVYFSDTSMTGCCLYCYDINTLSFQSMYEYDSYGYNNSYRRSVLYDGYLYWATFKLDPTDVSKMIKHYAVSGYGYGGTNQVFDKYVVLRSGIHDKETGKIIIDKDYYRFGSSTLLLTESGNVMNFCSKEFKIEKGALR